MRLINIRRVVAAAHSVFRHLFTLDNFHFDLIFDELAQVEVTRVQIRHNLFEDRIRYVVYGQCILL